MTMKARTNKQILEFVRENGYITERDILNLKSRLNNGRMTGSEADEITGLHPSVTDEQARKGFAWLWNLYKSPSGKVRKHNPFGAREVAALGDGWDASARFTFDGFVNVGRFVSYYVPVYTLERGDDTFQYYVNGGQIVICG